jgi:hypothetical protein
MTSIALPNTIGEALDGQQSGDAASPPPTISVITPASEKQEKYDNNKNGRHIVSSKDKGQGLPSYM